MGHHTCGVSGRLTYKACPDFCFCTHLPGGGNTDAYCQAPAQCSGQLSFSDKSGKH